MSKLASATGTASALAWTRGTCTPAWASSRRAWASWPFGEVEAGWPGAGSGEVDRPLGGAAAQLQDVAAGNLAEDVQLRLG